MKQTQQLINELMVALVREGCIDKCPYGSNEDFLYACAMYGYLDSVEKLKIAGFDIHCNEDLAFVFCCAYSGNMKIVKFFVEDGANIHARDDLAIFWAAENGHLEVVKYLEGLGCKLKQQNN